MPYQNVPTDKQDAMDACVQQVKNDGQDEQAAIAICYTSVVGGKTIDEAIALHNAETAQASAQRGELVLLAQAVLTAGDASTVKIQILRPGAFVDMNGLDVLIQDLDIEDYVANSNHTLNTTQIPVEIGHPYDPGAPAAAWYKTFFTELVNGVLWACAEIELTPLGMQALTDKLYKYFSGNLNLQTKEIIGGGFVNRPAVSGQQPIGALSAYLTPRAAALAQESVTKGGDTHMTEEQMQAQLAAVREEERVKMNAERAEWEAKLAEARQDERGRVLAEQKRAHELRELAATLTRGPKALWHKPADLEALLAKLTDDDRALVGELLKEIQSKGLVDLSEHGTQADGAQLTALPKFAARALAQYLEAKVGTIEDFFALNPELGTAQEYDLRVFAQ